MISIDPEPGCSWLSMLIDAILCIFEPLLKRAGENAL
jgi:hypothetical protein